MVTVWPIRFWASGLSATSLAVTLKVNNVPVTDSGTPARPLRSISLPASCSTRPTGPVEAFSADDEIVIAALGATTSDCDWKSTLKAPMLICGAVKPASEVGSDGMVSPFSSGRIVVRLPGPKITAPRPGLASVGTPVASSVIEPARVMLVVASATPNCSTSSPSNVMLPRDELNSPVLTTMEPAAGGGAEGPKGVGKPGCGWPL